MVVEQATSSMPIETRVAPDGVGYTWAEFENYFDAYITAAIWEAAEVDAATEPTPILISDLSSFRNWLYRSGPCGHDTWRRSQAR